MVPKVYLAYLEKKHNNFISFTQVNSGCGLPYALCYTLLTRPKIKFKKKPHVKIYFVH